MGAPRARDFRRPGRGAREAAEAGRPRGVGAPRAGIVTNYAGSLGARRRGGGAPRESGSIDAALRHTRRAGSAARLEPEMGQVHGTHLRPGEPRAGFARR